MTLLDLNYFTDLGLILSFTGVCGILINKLNIIISIICIELMLYGINFYLVTISLYLDDIIGQVMSLFILGGAAAESAVALALITSYFRAFQDISLKEIN
jgi:NADH-quinone oxidoreductase subunit K